MRPTHGATVSHVIVAAMYTGLDGDAMQSWTEWDQARRRRAVAQVSYIVNSHIACGRVTAINFFYRAKVQSHTVLTMGEWDRYLIQIHSLAYHDRLVMAPMHLGFEYGWCYPKGAAPVLAALRWDPYEHGEPHGFDARIGRRIRMAAETAPTGRTARLIRRADALANKQAHAG